MISLVTHVGYEGGDTADNINNPLQRIITIMAV